MARLVETHVSTKPRRDPVTLPTDELTCFTIDLYVSAHADLEGPQSSRVVALKVDRVEIVDVTPEGLESGLECYIEALLRYAVLPRLRLLLPVFVFDLPLNLGSVLIKAATTPPNNPAVEDDQLKVFVDMEVI